MPESRRVFMLALCTTLTGCANVSSDYQLNPTGQGLVVGSITTDVGLGLYTLQLVSLDTGKPVVPGPRTGGSMWPAIPPMRDADLGMDGGLFAIELAPGRYAMRRWNVRTGYTDRGSSTPFEIPFVIESGKATYLGNVHWPKNWAVTISDQSARDMPILTRRYATLNQAPLAYAIEPGKKMTGIGGSASKVTHIPIILPIPVAR